MRKKLDPNGRAGGQGSTRTRATLRAIADRHSLDAQTQSSSSIRLTLLASALSALKSHHGRDTLVPRHRHHLGQRHVLRPGFGPRGANALSAIL
jgi:hypothetical protein